MRARAAWAHDGGRDRRIAAAFLTLPGSAFTVDGAEPPANLALVSAGGELRIDQRLSLTARFDVVHGESFYRDELQGLVDDVTQYELRLLRAGVGRHRRRAARTGDRLRPA